MFRAGGSYFWSVFCFQLKQVGVLFSLGFNYQVLSTQRRAPLVLFTPLIGKHAMTSLTSPVLCKEASQSRIPSSRPWASFPGRPLPPEGGLSRAPFCRPGQNPAHPTPTSTQWQVRIEQPREGVLPTKAQVTVVYAFWWTVFGPSQFSFFPLLEKGVPADEKHPNFHRMLNMPRYQGVLFFFCKSVLQPLSHSRLEIIFSNEIIRLQE